MTNFATRSSRLKETDDFLAFFNKLIEEIPQFKVEYAKILTANRLEDFQSRYYGAAVFAVAAYLGKRQTDR